MGTLHCQLLLSGGTDAGYQSLKGGQDRPLHFSGILWAQHELLKKYRVFQGTGAPCEYGGITDVARRLVYVIQPTVFYKAQNLSIWTNSSPHNTLQTC